MESRETTVRIGQDQNVENKDATAANVKENIPDPKIPDSKNTCKSDNDLSNEVTLCAIDLNTAACSSRNPIPFSQSKSGVSEPQKGPEIHGVSKASYTITPPDTFNLSSSSSLTPNPLQLPTMASYSSSGANPTKQLLTSEGKSVALDTCASSSPTPQPLRIPSSTPNDSVSTVTSQPQRHFSNLPSPTSLIMNFANQPPSLFMQALSKLNENPISLAHLNKALRSNNIEAIDPTQSPGKSIQPELSPPESLASAPPSYSFVLRQMAARRPRLMGTFIPSPSFVQHTPPPNYAAAFDIYVEPTLPPQPTRVYSFGFTSMPAVCPECGYTGMTNVTTKITVCTHLCAMFLCLFCCWVCAPLPYILRSCKDAYHYCANCRSLLGVYCPTNPERRQPEAIRRF